MAAVVAAEGAGAGAGGGAPAPGGGGAVGPLGIPTSIVSFQQLYQEPGEDPYNGEYAAVMAAFAAPPTAPTGWSAGDTASRAITPGIVVPTLTDPTMG